MPHRACQHCNGDVHAHAVICRHCRKPLEARVAVHDGTCLFCREDMKPDSFVCGACGSDNSMRASFPVLRDGERRYAIQEPDMPGHFLEDDTVMAFMAAPSSTSVGGGGTGFIDWRRRCISVPLIECDVIEEVDPIAGFLPKRYENCRIVWKKVCAWVPF